MSENVDGGTFKIDFLLVGSSEITTSNLQTRFVGDWSSKIESVSKDD